MPLNPPPPRNEQVYLQKRDGSWVIGWANYCSLRGWRYWTRSLDAPRPSKVTSRYDLIGTVEILPVAWKPYLKPVIAVPTDPLSRREVEVILKRAVLTDGTLRKSGRDRLRSSWDSGLHNDGLSLIDQVNLEIFEKFTPEPFDNDNYLVGMDWLARINKKSKGFGDLNREQNAVIFRAYDFGFEWIGKEILGDVSRQRAYTVYHSAIDRVVSVALTGKAKVRRLSRDLWAK